MRELWLALALLLTGCQTTAPVDDPEGDPKGEDKGISTFEIDARRINVLIPFSFPPHGRSPAPATVRLGFTSKGGSAMRYLWFATALLLTGCHATAPADAPEGEPVTNDILFERPIGDAGQRLVVVRGPDRDPALFKSVRIPHPELRENYYEVRVELRSPEAEPVQLAARLRVESDPNVDKGSVVLDALVEDTNVALVNDADIVLAMAEGPMLSIWQIGIGHSPCWTPLRKDKGWTLNALRYRIDKKRVSMKLGRTVDGRLTVKVIEKDSRHHTIYEEVEKGSLRFKAVRQWHEARGQ